MSHIDMGLRPPVIELKNGKQNKLMPHDRAAHDWYRFVLSFPPHLVRQYIERFNLDHKSILLDPFCGTGTTLVECKKRGIPSIGVEAHPMACLASCVKTSLSEGSTTPGPSWSAPNRVVQRAAATYVV
jgi:hypothetical protein